ncbi:MAG: deoxyguanosinetriphosphate triphosphohydrolase [Nitratiruptor sp.]|nr:deoxyguanosinetriphosphate triphosphohydrolase [Nitratiruptor sp.]NPA82932.1 dNTP triphosphohydrolase [Campylobacterota bacterium]
MECHQRFYQDEEDFRSPFARDRDRILHSFAFRRLEYKTQVFINHVGDYFRTRLTHTLEVAQIARTIANALGLEESLTEAIALAHDLGHTPFGHSGEEELDRLIRRSHSPHGFDHNFQSFRIVHQLERRFKEFPGLNLTFATLEGILKHTPPYPKPFLGQWYHHYFNLDRHPCLEAMVVDRADEIAYLSADIDDGIKYGLIHFHQIASNPLVQEVMEEVQERGYDPQEKLFRHRFTSRLISKLVASLIANSINPAPGKILCKSLEATTPPPIAHDSQMEGAITHLKGLLHRHLYRHPSIVRKMYAGKRCIAGLFDALLQEPRLMPEEFYRQSGQRPLHRVVADFIAGMTDRYALRLYRELYGVEA